MSKETLEPLADLVVSQKLAAIKGRFPSLNCVDESVFFLEELGDQVLYEFSGRTALLGRALRQAIRQVGLEFNFHAPRLSHYGMPLPVFSSRSEVPAGCQSQSACACVA